MSDVPVETGGAAGADEFESQLEDINIKLQSFEGPLDLLVHLIRKNQINVYDIPIALVTEQYLEYLSLMQELNLDVASEFLVMAATLIHIKSRMLLPRPDPAQIDEGEDDRSLESWRENHSRYWRRTAAALGFEWTEAHEILFERFSVVWPELYRPGAIGS